MADTNKKSLYTELSNNAKRIIDPVVGGVRGGVILLFIITVLMWICNIAGFNGVNIILAFFGLGLIGFVFTKPDLLLHVIPIEGFFSWLRDEDASQGAANSLGKLSRIGIGVIFAFSMNSVALATWSFAQAPMAFWGLELIIIAFASWGAIYRSRGDMSKKITAGYLTVAALALIWSTFGITLDYGVPDQVRDESGNIIVMYNPVTKEFAPDVSVSECASRLNGCFGVEGNKLEPVTQESVNNRNPKVWLGKTVDLPYFWQTLVGIVTLTLLLVFVPGVRGAIVPVALIAVLLGAVWYMLSLERSPSSKVSTVATSTTDCGGKITPKVGETFVLKKGCSYIFDQRLMPDGFDIAPIQAGIDGTMFWVKNPKHRTTAGHKEARIDTVEDAFVGRSELRMFFAPFKSSDSDIKLLRTKLRESSTEALAAVAKVEAK